MRSGPAAHPLPHLALEEGRRRGLVLIQRWRGWSQESTEPTELFCTVQTRQAREPQQRWLLQAIPEVSGCLMKSLSQWNTWFIIATVPLVGDQLPNKPVRKQVRDQLRCEHVESAKSLGFFFLTLAVYRPQLSWAYLWLSCRMDHQVSFI